MASSRACVSIITLEALFEPQYAKHGVNVKNVTRTTLISLPEIHGAYALIRKEENKKKSVRPKEEPQLLPPPNAAGVLLKPTLSLGAALGARVMDYAAVEG